MEEIEEALFIGCNVIVFVLAVVFASYLLTSYHILIEQTYRNTNQEHIVEMKEDGL